jgi:hypothetical protein
VAIVLNLTVTAPTQSGFITAGDDEHPPSATSTLNFARGQTAANLAILPVGSDGAITITNRSSGTIQLTADYTGYYPVASGYQPVPPIRVLDTRTGLGASKTAIAAGASLHLKVAGKAGLPTGGTSSIAVNLTVTAPARSGYLTAFADATTPPAASTVNFSAGQAASNFAIVAVGTDGAVTITNHSPGTIQLTADVTGYFYPTAAGYRPVPPMRVLDTRTGLGAPKLAVAAGTSLHLKVAGKAGLPATGTAAVVVNLIVAGSTRSGFVSAFADGTTPEATSTVNFSAGETTASLAIVAVGSDGAITITNRSPGTIQLIADVSGYHPANAAQQPVPTADVWAQSAGDGGNNSYNPGEHLLTPATVSGLTHQWRVPNGASLFAPVISDGIAYLPINPNSGDASGELRAVDSSSGRMLWQVAFPLGFSAYRGLAVADGTVYVPGDGAPASVLAIGITTHRITWRAQVSPPPNIHLSNRQVYGFGVDRGQFFVLADSGIIDAFDSKTGQHRWSMNTVDPDPTVNAGGDTSGITAHDGILFFKGWQGVVAFDEATGTQLWAGSAAGIPVAAAGRVFIGEGSSIHAFAEGGCGKPRCAPLWDRDIRTSAEISALALPTLRVGGADASTLFVSVYGTNASNGRVVALDARTGATIWTANFATHNFNAPPVRAGNVVYVFEEDHLVALPTNCAAVCHPISTIDTIENSTGFPQASIAVANGLLLVQGWGSQRIDAYRLPGS